MFTHPGIQRYTKPREVPVSIQVLGEGVQHLHDRWRPERKALVRGRSRRERELGGEAVGVLWGESHSWEIWKSFYEGGFEYIERELCIDTARPLAY